MGFLGAVLLIGTSGLGLAEGRVETLARFACVAAAFCYACGSIATRQCPPINELALSTGSLILAALFLLPIALLVEGPPNLPSLSGLLAVGYLGLVPTALALVIKVAVIRSAGPSFMTLTNYQVPVWSVLAGSLFLGRNPAGDTLRRSGFDLVGGGDYSSEVSCAASSAADSRPKFERLYRFAHVMHAQDLRALPSGGQGHRDRACHAVLRLLCARNRPN